MSNQDNQKEKLDPTDNFTQHVEAKEGSNISDVIQVKNLNINLNINVDKESQKKLPPFEAPPVPEYFIERPSITDGLKSRLINKELNSSGVLTISAIYGLGGIGKSTIVASLAHDNDVKGFFSDGILWASLGQEPDLFSLLRGRIQAIDEDKTFNPINIETASSRLRTLLQNKKVLLIIDDVWDSSHIKPFMAGSNLCQLLITTRRNTAVEEIGAHTYEVGILSEEESLNLIGNCVGHSLDKEEKEEISKIAKLLGYLPLALQMAATRKLRDEIEWTKLRAMLEDEINRLSSLEPLSNRLKGNIRIEATFNLSLNALRDYGKAWELFIWLGILPEDIALTAPIAATIWGIKVKQAEEFLELFWSESLLLRATNVFVEETSYKAYILHDLLHDVLRKTITLAIPQGLGLTQSEAHNLFISKVFSQNAEEKQIVLEPNNRYIRSKLLWHMKKAERVEDIHSLLVQETKEGKNQWYEIKNSVGETGDYIQDINYALKLTKQPEDKPFNTNQQTIDYLILQLRYILILVSLNNLAENLSVNLLVALIKYQVWSVEQGLAYVKQIRQTQQQTYALIAIIPYLPEQLRDKTVEMALTKAQSINDNIDKAETLVEISPSLPERIRENVVQQALLVGTKVDRANIAGVFRVIAPYLSNIDLQQQAFNEALKVEDDVTQVAILANLAPHFPEQLKQEAMEKAFSLFKGMQQKYGEYYLANTLEQIGVSLPEPLLLEALTEAKKIKSNQYRDKAISGLIPRFVELSEHQQAILLINEIKGEEYLANALRVSSPYLPIDILGEMIVTAEAIKDKKYKSNALSGLIPRLATLGEQKNAIYKVREITYEAYLRKALVDLAPNIPITELETWEKVLNLAISIKNEYCKKEAFVELSSYSPTKLLQQIIYDNNLTNKRYIAQVFTSVALRLPEELQKSTLLQALSLEREIGDLYYQVSVLASLAPYLPESMLEQVIEMTLRVQNEHHKVKIITKLIPFLSQLLLLKILEYSTNIADNQLQAKVLTTLLPHLPNSHKADTLKLAFDAAVNIKDIQYKIPAIVSLIPYFPKKFHLQLLKVFEKMEDEGYQVKLIVGLIPHLSISLLQQVFVRAKEISNEEHKGALLSALATKVKKCSGKFFNQIFNLAKLFYEPKNQTRVLINLATHVSGNKEKLILNALTVARKIKDEEDRAIELIGILPSLSELSKKEVLEEIVELAQRIEDDDRVDILKKIIPILPEHLKEKVIKLAINTAKSLNGERLRSFQLADLMPYLSTYLTSNEWDHLLSEAKNLEDPINQIRLLSAMLPHLSETLKQEVILRVLNLIKEVDDEEELEDVINNVVLQIHSLVKIESLHFDNDILQVLSGFNRKQVLIIMKFLMPIVVDLVGVGIIDEIFKIISDTSRWWN